MIFAGQWGAFLITVFAGVLLGVIFDFFRILGGRISFRGYFTTLADLLFWLVATVVVFAAFIFGNWGEVRLYMFIGLLAGVILYYRLCSRAVMKTIVFALDLLAKIVNALGKLIGFIVKPFALIVKIACWPAVYLRQKFRREKVPPDGNIPPQ